MTPIADGEQYDADAGPVDAGPVDTGNVESDEGETEDEEVKRTCIGGLSRMRDSDSGPASDETSCGDERERADEDEDDSDEEKEPSFHSNIDANEGLVEFVSDQVSQEGRIYRPTPMIPNLTTHTEESQESSSDSEET
jgi:hypothetical protein